MINVCLKLFAFLIGVSFTLTSYSQTYSPIDSVNFFTSIKFGDKIPKQLIKCANDGGADYPRIIDLNLNVDGLTPDCKKKYSDLFAFLSVHFSFVKIFTNNSGEILAVKLAASAAKGTDSATATTIPLVLYNQIRQQMERLYKSPTQTEIGNGMDTALLRKWRDGIPLMAAWYGYHVSVILRAEYGSPYGINGLTLDIRDQRFEEAPKQEELSE